MRIPDNQINDIRNSVNIVDVIGCTVRLKKQGQVFKALCPFHQEKTPSFSVHPDKQIYKCFGCNKSGDIFEFLIKNQGITFYEAVKQVADRAGIEIGSNGSGNSNTLEPTYDYVDESGTLQYQSCRLSGKQFRLRKPDGSGGWIWNIRGVKPVMYRLPQVLEAVKKGRSIFIVEGEKDVHTLEFLGFVATTNSGGAGKWKLTFSTWLQNADVIIIPDNDDPGRSHAEDIALKLHGSAADIKILDLPDLQPKQDVTDWMKNGGTKDQLIDLVNDTPFWKQSDKPQDTKTTAQSDKLIQSDLTNFENTHLTPSETWNADFLASNFGDLIRYNHTLKMWHIWDGTRWQPDKSKQIIQLVKKNAEEIFKFASCIPQSNGEQSNDQRKKAFSWALKSEQKAGIINALELAESIPRISMEQKDFDQNPYLFNCKNGTYNLQNGRFNEHRQSDNLTKRSEVEFDRNAEAPYWYESLNLIFNDDEELIRFIQQGFGYSLSGLVDEEVLFFCYGEGANGKSRLFDVFEMLLGDYFLKTHADLFTIANGQSKSDYHIANLPGVRLAVASELDKSQMFHESLIKDLTGGDILSARFPFGRPFTFNPTHKLWMSGNSEPRVRATDEGFWRRIRKVPFTVEIPEKKRKPKSELLEIYRNELPGILNWAITGYQDYVECGKLIIPASVKSATLEYREDSDVIRSFLKECIEEVIGENTSVKTVYKKYKDWCDENNENKLKKITFGKMLQNAGYKRPSKGTNNVSMWEDLEIVR